MDRKRERVAEGIYKETGPRGVRMVTGQGARGSVRGGLHPTPGNKPPTLALPAFTQSRTRSTQPTMGQYGPTAAACGTNAVQTVIP